MTDPDDGLELARQVARAYRGKRTPASPGRRRKGRPATPARDNNEDATPLSALLDQVVSQRGWTDKLSDQRIFTQWPSLVGPDIAQHTVVEGYEDGVVHVRATSTAWATQLKLLAPRFVAKLNQELGESSVLRIEVRGPQAPSWKKGPRSIRGARGPRDTYG